MMNRTLQLLQANERRIDELLALLDARRVGARQFERDVCWKAEEIMLDRLVARLQIVLRQGGECSVGRSCRSGSHSRPVTVTS